MLRIAARVTPSHSTGAGAAPILHAATHPQVDQGAYYGPRFGLVGPPAPIKLPRRGRDEAVAARLWTVAEQLTGVSLDSIGSEADPGHEE